MHHHPGNLMPLQLLSEARKTVSLRERDVVVYEDDLVPAMQAGEQQADVTLQA